MIQLTKDLAMIADKRCYIVGKPKQKPGKAIEIQYPTYYSTAEQAVKGALGRHMRELVADGSITTLRQFVEEQDRRREELENLIAPLE